MIRLTRWPSSGYPVYRLQWSTGDSLASLAHLKKHSFEGTSFTVDARAEITLSSLFTVEGMGDFPTPSVGYVLVASPVGEFLSTDGSTLLESYEHFYSEEVESVTFPAVLVPTEPTEPAQLPTECSWTVGPPPPPPSVINGVGPGYKILIPAVPGKRKYLDRPAIPPIPAREVEVVAVRRHWGKVGVELEGSWRLHSRAAVQALYPKVSCISDGSVTTCIPGGFNGEARVGPYMKWASVEKAVHLVFPDLVNASCGLHVHVSFRPGDYSRLMDRAFWLFFKGRWNTWGENNKIADNHEFWKRLDGHNNYCLSEFDPRVNTNQSRYHALNFTSYQKHKTLECRLLPAFHDPRLAIAAIAELLAIYEDWLNIPVADTEVVAEAVGPFAGDNVAVLGEDEAPLRLSVEVDFDESILLPVGHGSVRVYEVSEETVTRSRAMRLACDRRLIGE